MKAALIQTMMEEKSLHELDKNQFNLDRCYVFYFDEKNNTANYTTTPPPLETTPTGQTSTGQAGFWKAYLVPVIAGSVGVVVLACCLILCCVCTARRERKKRKEIEGEYKIVASTLTNITDSEDGCTYETLSMRDPTYNSGVKLPTRKHKGKIKGVSNPFSVVRRLLSEDGESTGSTDTTITFASPDYKRSQPLPAIPEAFNNKDNIKAIDEYTEIGSEATKFSNEYHHLHMSGKIRNDFIDANPYDALRQSQLLKYEQDAKKTDEYFVLESTKSEECVQNIPTEQQSGGYFSLEKVQRVNSGSGLCNTSSQGVVIPPESVRALENNLVPIKNTEGVPNGNQEEAEGESSEVRKSDTNNYLEQTQNTYFTLAKENDSNTSQLQPPNEYLDLENMRENRASYIEPSEIHGHSYVDLVADFANGKNTKGGSIPAYAAVKK